MEVGSDKNSVKRFCLIVSPLTDEMYRDGSGPYYDPNVRADVRGYPRDHFANAGAVEIYWTKFDPDVANGGYWTTPPPNGIQSLKSNQIYYLVTNPPTDNQLITFPRYTFDTTLANYGFLGWESNQPENPGDNPVNFRYPLVQPSVSVTSTKQTYTAKWVKDKFRVDFDLQHDGLWENPITNLPGGRKISAPTPEPTWKGYTFEGWFMDPKGKVEWDFLKDRVYEDTTLYAKWTKVETPKPPAVTPPTPASPTCPTCPIKPAKPCPVKPVKPCPVKPVKPAKPCPVVKPVKPVKPCPVVNPVKPSKPSHTVVYVPTYTEPASPSAMPNEPETPPANQPPSDDDANKGNDNGINKPDDTTTIQDNKVPLFCDQSDAWSLLNLIITIIGTIGAILLILRYLSIRRRMYDEDNILIVYDSKNPNGEYEFAKRTKKGTLPFVILNAIAAVATIILFIALEDMHNKMCIIDVKSIWFIILFVTEVMFTIYALGGDDE
jgi:uncharacterized repeat protein (TIGR02543 family)